MQLFPHQQKALEQTERFNRVAYYLDMGLGKTFVGSEKADSFPEKIVLVCQKSKIDDWIEHFQQYYHHTVFDLTNKKHLYGQYDGRIFNGEMSMDWGGDLKFVPLDVPMDEDLQEFIFYLSAGYNIDFTLVMAMIQQESGFQADVISGSNDYGLMQINKINHPYITETLGITDFLE